MCSPGFGCLHDGRARAAVCGRGGGIGYFERRPLGLAHPSTCGGGVVLAILQGGLVGLVPSENALLLRDKGFFCSDISDRRLRDGYLCGQQETYRAARLLWPS